jgi:transcription elongation GreA/GreB family factor
MSRAFVKDSDDVVELPDRIISDYPNYVTPDGMSQIQKTVAKLQEELAEALKKEDRSLRSSISRDLRYWENRQATAIVVQLAADPPLVRFGSCVIIERDDGRRQSYRIVGEDEADPAKGLLSHASPLARSLLGKSKGETVSTGKDEYEIVEVKIETSAKNVAGDL